MVCQNKTNKTVLKENLVVFGILGTTVLSGALLTLPSVLADDVVDTITITVPTSCSMSSTIATGDEHTAEINNGQYDSAIGETTIKAFCNDNEGFAIYAIGYTDNELGKNVLTNSTLGSTHDIITGTAITGNTSQWAMKLSKLTGSEIHYPIIIAGSSEDSLKQTGDADFSDFTNVPDDYKKVAYRTASTDINPVGQQTAEGSTLKTTYQAYISPTQAAGEYTGQVKYTMVHPYDGAAPKKPKSLDTATTMQDVTFCSEDLREGQVYTLTDSRDNNVYHVARLADGNCWMLDNLALDLTDSAVLNGMNENNTHASNTTLGYLKGTTTRDPSTDPDGQYATAAVSNWTSGYSYSAPLVNMTNKDVVPQGDDPMASTVLAGNWKVGGYYNYCAASAGSYCYGNGTSEGTSSGNATEDICPRGWRMPTGNTSGEYSALANAIYGSTGSTSDATAYANYRSALRLPLSGYFRYGSAYSQGSLGYWWSSTRYDNDIMYYLYADTSTIGPAYRYDRYRGYSVRCVLGS